MSRTGPETAPWSLTKLLEHLKLNYGNPPVWIHENGYGDAPDTLSKVDYEDSDRTEFLQNYLEVLYLSIRCIYADISRRVITLLLPGQMRGCNLAAGFLHATTEFYRKSSKNIFDRNSADPRVIFLPGKWCCRNGSNGRGYFVWSFLDVFEFLFGYQVRFGLCGVDMSDEARRRYVRSSARWYSGFLHGGELRPVQSEKFYVA